jgi:hypothetical protein
VLNVVGVMVCFADQIDGIQVGAWLYVRNSKIEMYASHMRLAVDRWGLIEPVPAKEQPKEEVNLDADKNLSQTEYELVNVPA